jgi:tetratricopeptide (TPR) repeat protein
MRRNLLTTFSTVCLLCGGWSGAAGDEPPYRAESTRRMAERLVQIERDVDAKNTLLLTNDRRVELCKKALADAPDDVKVQLAGGFALANELLRDGRPEEAIEEFEKVSVLATANSNLVGGAFWPQYRAIVALSHLRLGEQENCICEHSTDSCLMPIGGSGIHKKQRGSRKAIELYQELLAANPNDMVSLWLLNIAYMTLGEHPGSVPPQWLIPPSAFKSDYDIKRFHDAAPHLGLARRGLAGGCVVEDLDGDGYLDVMTSDWGLHAQIRYFRNNADGTFSDRTEAAGLTGIVGGLNLVHADYNNDGHPDVFVLRGAWLLKDGNMPNSLLRNNGDGTFDDVTEEAGVLSFHPTQTAAWGDFDNDGWLDLYIGNESGHPRGTAAGWAQAIGTGSGQPLLNPCELYHNNRDGTFSEIAAASGVANIGYVKAVVWGDYNNDGRPDLYLSRMGSTNVLYRNDGPAASTSPGGGFAWSFTDVTEQAGVAEPIISFPTWFWDYDNDGWLDIFVAGYAIGSVGDVANNYLGKPFTAIRPHLYHNKHDGTFEEVGVAAGLNTATTPMGANFGDLDNDGWLDFYLGTGDPDYSSLVPNRAFRNDGHGHFQDVTTSGGFGHLQKGHGVAFADIDNDGDQDIYHVLGGAYTGDAAFNVLFENPGHGNHWITLRIEGVQSNRSAIGARVKVTVQTGVGQREIHVVVGTGGSFGSSSLQQEIGLGQATAIRSIDITWPTTGKTQSFSDVAMDQIVAIREGDPQMKKLELKVLHLSPDDAVMTSPVSSASP